MKIIYLFFLSLLVSNSIGQTNTIGAITNTPEALDGYTLFAPLLGFETYLINNCGEEVHRWVHSTESRFSVELMEDGHLLRSAKGIGYSPTGTSGGKAGRLEKVDWDGNVVWSYNYISQAQSDSGQYITHHDFEILPNGNIFLLTWENQPKSVLLEHGLGSGFDKDYIWMEKIIEIEPTGTNGANIVWEWNVFDHLIQRYDSNKLDYGKVIDHPHRFNINHGASYTRDLFHANSIDYNSELDQILITMKHLNEFWIIDHSTTTAEAASSTGGLRGKGGDILYRWGNPLAYDVVAPRILLNPHHAEWIPENYRDGGKISVYNNGSRWSNTTSKVAIIDPHINNDGSYPSPDDDEAFLPESTYWEYEMDLSIVGIDFVSDQLSSVYRLDNGNTLITNGRVNGYIIELDSNDNIVWEYFSPVGAKSSVGETLGQGTSLDSGFYYFTDIFRAIKYKPNYIGFLGQDLTPGIPLELNPNLNACTLYPDSTLEPISINELDLNITYTNPITTKFEFKNPDQKEITISIHNISGQMIHSSIQNNSFVNIDVAHWVSGIYFLDIRSSNKQVHKGKLVKL